MRRASETERRARGRQRRETIETRIVVDFKAELGANSK